MSDPDVPTAMKILTYDNPKTFRRECWEDGELLCFYSAHLLLRRLTPFEKQPIPKEYFFFGANIGPWKAGQFVGDMTAMDRR